MLSRSCTEKSPDTARTHCCPKVRLMNQSSHRYTSMQFNQRVPTCVAVLSNSTAAISLILPSCIVFLVCSVQHSVLCRSKTCIVVFLVGPRRLHCNANLASRMLFVCSSCFSPTKPNSSTKHVRRLLPELLTHQLLRSFALAIKKTGMLPSPQ